MQMPSLKRLLTGGVVGTVGADYLGLLVLGLFNAVVGREHIPGHLRCRPAQGCWASDTDRRLRLEVGTPVDFVVAQCAPSMPHAGATCIHFASHADLVPVPGGGAYV